MKERAEIPTGLRIVKERQTFGAHDEEVVEMIVVIVVVWPQRVMMDRHHCQQ